MRTVHGLPGMYKLGKPIPCLWSSSHHHQHGKFVADGRHPDTAVDGWPGERPSNAFKKVTGSCLPGDPRE